MFYKSLATWWGLCGCGLAYLDFANSIWSILAIFIGAEKLKMKRLYNQTAPYNLKAKRHNHGKTLVLGDDVMLWRMLKNGVWANLGIFSFWPMKWLRWTRWRGQSPNKPAHTHIIIITLMVPCRPGRYEF